MNFDYKRCPIIETAADTHIHYDSADRKYSVNTVIAEFDTRPFHDAEELKSKRRMTTITKGGYDTSVRC